MQQRNPVCSYQFRIIPMQKKSELRLTQDVLFWTLDEILAGEDQTKRIEYDLRQ